eukprot:7692242-Pyramimonas_sp.AAC.1
MAIDNIIVSVAAAHLIDRGGGDTAVDRLLPDPLQPGAELHLPVSGLRGVCVCKVGDGCCRTASGDCSYTTGPRYTSESSILLGGWFKNIPSTFEARDASDVGRDVPNLQCERGKCKP